MATAAAARRVVKLETAIDDRGVERAPSRARPRGSGAGARASRRRRARSPATTNAASMNRSGPSVIASIAASTAAPLAAR